MKQSRVFTFLAFLVLMASFVLGVTPSYAQGGSEHDALLSQIPTLENLAKQADKTFVGEVEGSYAYIAFVVKDNLAVIYVCDSISVYPWIKAKIVDGAIRATDEKSGVQIIATVTADAINGTVALATDDDGSKIVPHKFTTASAVPGKTGLARFVDVGTVGGWIVTKNGIRGQVRSGSCEDYRNRVLKLRDMYFRAKAAGTSRVVLEGLANNYTSAALDATIAGCGDVTQ